MIAAFSGGAVSSALVATSMAWVRSSSLPDRDDAPARQRRGFPSTPRADPPFGVSYTERGAFDLAPLPEAEREAREIASVFGEEAIINADVTKSSVLEALGHAEYVHVAAHGRQDVEAPAFQCLYLTPEADSNGRLEAHELLTTDMRGTRVLTLSACETSLGRFDSRDNLRGLPAAFLLAGVRTIIGTLWPVDTNASRLFFTSFYAQLRDATPLLDAFVAAQDATRAQFPAYRDWGPFLFVGDWQ